MILILLTGLLLLIYVFLLLYYRSGWNSIPLFIPKTFIQPEVFISVIIPARNEESNLPYLLQGLMNQNYINFEVIVIDDHSTDKTSTIVNQFPLANLRLLHLRDFITDGINSYKKKAIEAGISQARGELIVTTDADCIIPVTWLQTLASFYEERKPSFIVMPVAINCGNRFIEIFQALDFMSLQGITGAAVQKKVHSMCNGANLAYTKKAFVEAEGFKGIDNIASGDDMLLMHKIYKLNPAKVLYLKSNEVIVQTQPMYTIKDFISQRIRWASKAHKYDDKRIIMVLTIVYCFNAILFVLPVVAIFKNYMLLILNYQLSIIELWALLILCKTVAELFFLLPVAKFFNKQPILISFPLFQPFHILYTVIAPWLGMFGSYQWKGRKVK